LQTFHQLVAAKNTEETTWQIFLVIENENAANGTWICLDLEGQEVFITPYNIVSECSCKLP
jgi:hypothetical protein